MRFAIFGSSLVSAYWNGSCTYYRGIVRALHAQGHQVTFFEPDAYDRQAHRDIADPEWATVVVYPALDEASVRDVVARAAGFDVVAKTSGVGVYDELLEAAVLELPGVGLRIFWDVDAPATLGRMERDRNDRLRGLLGDYDLVLTYGGGKPVIERYAALGARACIPVYNALDPETHHPAPPRAELAADLTLLANRLPDREARVQEFFFDAVARSPHQRFLLGGNGWDDRKGSGNLRLLGHVAPGEHNAVNCSALAVLNVTREDMVANGWSPATRVFEAAGAGACLISDTWLGMEEFLEPGCEVLLASSGAEVAGLLADLEPGDARVLGEAARQRMLGEHTYAHRAAQIEEILAVYA